MFWGEQTIIFTSEQLLIELRNVFSTLDGGTAAGILTMDTTCVCFVLQD